MKNMGKIGKARSAERKIKGHYHPFRKIFKGGGGGKILKRKEKHTKRGQNLELEGGGQSPLFCSPLGTGLRSNTGI